MNLLVGGALAPVHTIPPPRPQQKAGPGLRLPSFEALGIAAPHPDRYGHQLLDSALDATHPGVDMVGMVESMSHADSELLDACRDLQLSLVHDIGILEPPKLGGRAVQSPVHQFISTLTPPAETGELTWSNMPAMTSIPMESPSTDPGNLAGTPGDAPTAGPALEGSAAPGIALQPPDVSDTAPWVVDAVQVLVQNLRHASLSSNPLRVLSHALPSPSATGHIFPEVISAIHNSTPSSPTVWVNVFHAIPGRFNLADLPTSPPSTPGPPIGGDDYFTQKVFDSAVPISDYQQDLSSLPRSPRPVVPPSSIDVSVVERYIPPSTLFEFTDMFNTQGPSILVDRLVELSPHSGSLLFVYPTRTGARTFLDQYLSPIIDPLLRSICVLHGLSSDLSRQLGSMPAVDRLLEHTDVERQVRRLCDTLTQRSTSMQRFHGRRAKFELQYSAKKEVPVSRETWARDWWTKQEKSRVREVVTQYAQQAQTRSSNEHVERPATPTELIQRLLDGVTKNPYKPGQTPTKGIEVSILVIKRSE
ncbi:hypothetical protein BAUCODRAFT_60933 [Baudoinia panamericana UAMH 10762]|uniref:Uncharacterized protein n=1 Tax=Baudoinia panamericana (strain UAMH 10762) TaxID=717646 RepID=M2N933_BAUPA|nr:uncharacterized protein BAUCODRAFT_60933 [Baudoinia panamericana UAMH 10762]EMD00669.1 hypothetical protein BAUCODRAFT_60933 [Baudoinia panamericana UAMH 10762]